MSAPNPYTPEQAFARDLLITAVNGGINDWARVYGYSVDGPAEQIRAEGIDTFDRRPLAALADQLQLSLAYVDRDTVEAHVERALSDAEWAAANDQFAALDLDEHVGDHGTFLTDWIESVLEKACVPGYGYTAEGWHSATANSDRGGATA